MLEANTDLERLLGAERALSQGDQEGALDLLTDVVAVDALTMDAIVATWNGDLRTAELACRRLIDAVERVVAA